MTALIPDDPVREFSVEAPAGEMAGGCHKTSRRIVLDTAG